MAGIIEAAQSGVNGWASEAVVNVLSTGRPNLFPVWIPLVYGNMKEA